jgi:hypothetical protein
MPTRRKAKRRIIMGEGHPFYFTGPDGDTGRSPFGTAVCLTKRRIPSSLVELKWGNTGNWNKVRLVLEVIE